MNGGDGGCFIARYGGEGGMYGLSKVDKIMLKYRPIAPKPVTDGSASGDSEDRKGYVKCGRSKRKYVRVKENNSKKRKVTTLSLLPETPDRSDNEPVTGSLDLVSLVNKGEKVCYGLDPVVRKPVQPQPQPPQQPKVVSYVTVECVTDTWMDIQRCTNEERVKDMEMDTCPGFISDGQDRVVWTNQAYKQMVGFEHVSSGDDVTVVVVWKDKWTTLEASYPGFTCKVKVTSGKHSTTTPVSPTLTLLCDVWRMEQGKFAWRLDVKAALSLGR